MEKLEAWRKQKKNERKMAYMVFKKEEDDYKKYKMEKEESLRVNGVCSQQERIETVQKENPVMPMQVDQNENENEDGAVAFNPFEGIDDDDSDEDIDIKEQNVNLKQNQSFNPYDASNEMNEYGEFDGYDSFGDDGEEMIDFDADPFA